MKLTHKIDKDGNLVFRVDGAGRKELRQDRKERDDFESNWYLGELFEKFIQDTEFDWIEPEEIGALTDAPILGIRKDIEPDGMVEKAWWYPNYAVNSPQRDLAEYGKAVFESAN